MLVELFYFSQCPHWTVMNERLRQALERHSLPTHIERRLVETFEDAQAVSFQGSPSVRLDGRDPFTSTGDVGLTCRVYATPEGPAGSPTLDQLVVAVENHLIN